MSHRFWEVPLLCTPDAIEAEEEELLRLLAEPHSKSAHQALVGRWQAMLSAKALLHSSIQPQPTTSNAATANENNHGCRSCQSAPCECVRYKR